MGRIRLTFGVTGNSMAVRSSRQSTSSPSARLRPANHETSPEICISPSGSNQGKAEQHDSHRDSGRFDEKEQGQRGGQKERSREHYRCWSFHYAIVIGGRPSESAISAAKDEPKPAEVSE